MPNLDDRVRVFGYSGKPLGVLVQPGLKYNRWYEWFAEGPPSKPWVFRRMRAEVKNVFIDGTLDRALFLSRGQPVKSLGLLPYATYSP